MSVSFPDLRPALFKLTWTAAAGILKLDFPARVALAGSLSDLHTITNTWWTNTQQSARGQQGLREHEAVHNTGMSDILWGHLIAMMTRCLWWRTESLEMFFKCEELLLSFLRVSASPLLSNTYFNSYYFIKETCRTLKCHL